MRCHSPFVCCELLAPFSARRRPSSAVRALPSEPESRRSTRSWRCHLAGCKWLRDPPAQTKTMQAALSKEAALSEHAEAACRKPNGNRKAFVKTSVGPLDESGIDSRDQMSRNVGVTDETIQNVVGGMVGWRAYLPCSQAGTLSLKCYVGCSRIRETSHYKKNSLPPKMEAGALSNYLRS